MDELRLALRRLLKRPASTLASIATLACAIGAAAVTWSALSAVLIHPLPIKDPDTLFVVANERPGRTGPIVSTGFLYPKYQQIRDSGVFAQTAAYWGSHLLLVSVGDLPTRTDVGFVTHDFYDVLGVRAVLGREFVEADDRRGAAPVAVLTDRYWRRTFNADPSVVGRTITVAGKPVPIVGVLERGYRGMTLTEKPDLYLAFHTLPEMGGPTTNYFAEAGHPSSPTAGTGIIGRLAAGTSVVEATERIAALDPPTRSGSAATPLLMTANVAAIPAAVRPGMDRFARLLAATVGLLLFIGCTTVGMLLLIRTEARRAEFAMCMALGASRGRLARGIALEGALLAATGSVLALPVAWWLFNLIQAFQLPGNIPIELLELSLDIRVIAACVTAASVSVLLISVVAGAFGFRADVADALRARSGAAPTQRRVTRGALVATQVAVAVTLVAGAGLFARSLISALSLNAATDMSRLVITTVPLSQYGYTPQRASEFFDALDARLSANPAVASVAFSMSNGGMSSGGRITIDGVPRQFPSTVWNTVVDDRYFTTMGLRLVEGRAFTAQDRAGAPLVAIVSESYARMIGEGKSVLGTRITATSGRAGEPRDVMEIVGVVADVVTRVTVLEPLAIYQPLAQVPPRSLRDLVVRASGNAAAARDAIMSTVRELDRQVMPTPPRTLEERIAEQMAPQQLGATVLGALGAVAVLLTLLGTYVLAESMASARMKEMGIRAALGATRRQLGSIVLADTAKLAGIGILAGLGLAWLGTSTIRSFLFQVQPFDPTTIGGVSALILVLALAVSLRAALRVARVDLASVLRNE
jgi:putative ABC transport system permease protein